MVTMREPEAGETNPELKALVVEATRALALLDGQRLEQLVGYCEALNRKLQTGEADPELRIKLAHQARPAAAAMAVFARVLHATRANLAVMNRLRELRLGQLEYQAKPVAWAEAQLESGDGND
jgi:hypothetical protein